MSQFRSLWFTAAIAAITAGSPAFAQEDEGDEDEAQTIEGFTEEFETIDGLFPLYRNPEDGALYMEIAADQLDDEFVYFTYAEDGAPRTGLFRGQFRDNRVLTFSRHYGEIEISAENTSFSFDEDNALSRASSANITRAPLAVLEIEAETEGEDDASDRFLVQIDSLLSGEDLSQIKPNAPRGPGAEDAFSMGRLSSDRTRVLDIRNYPENTDVVVEYVYTEDSPRNGGGEEITDARAVAVTVQHSFLALPEDGYEPRADDFRVGYFGQRVTNLTDTSVTPYDDVINRWRLVKQDPTAEISDPVEPIVWWIENTTPVELRDIIRDAALTWNIAFEAAGFSNALEVRVQPDDADWDAGDIRYNVLRWTSSPTPPFGGYGPSFTNPRTGEIMGADIMLEYVFMTNRIRYSELFDVAGLSQWLPAEQLAEATGEPVIEHDHDAHGAMCNFAEHLQMETLSGVAALQAQGASTVQVDELIRQSLHYLVIHEIGHTLGLMHNMRASSTISLDDLANGQTVTGSIMDYPALNLPTQDGANVQYSQETPGPYDIWAISYGYNPDTEALPSLLEQSTDPALAFGNDADDLRAPGRHSDPRVMINDLSSDPVSWASQRVELINNTLRTLPENFEIEGETYQPLLTSYLVLSGQRFGAANVASRHIGGIYNNRSVVGQPGAETPFIPVSREKQEQALDVLDAALFGPDAFAAEEAYLDHLQRQRRFFDHFGSDEDPALHERAFNQQRGVMAHLLHPNMLERMNDARQYGGEYPVADYLQDLTQMVYAADIRGEPNTYRQNLQVEYLRQLISIVGDGDYAPVTRSAALAAIHDVKGWVGPEWMPDLMGSREAKAHRAHLRALINAFEG